MSSNVTTNNLEKDIPNGNSKFELPRIRLPNNPEKTDVGGGGGNKYNFDDDNDANDENDPGIVSRIVKSIHTRLHHIIVKNKKVFKTLMILILFGLYVAYMGVAIAYNIRNEIEINWCDGFGMLLILSGLFISGLVYYLILKKYFGKTIKRNIIKPIGRRLNPIFQLWYINLFIVIGILGGIGIFLYFDTKDQPARLISAGGLVVLIIFGLLISKHPGHVKWNSVLWGLGLQFIMGIIVLRWPSGKLAFECLSGKIRTFLEFTNVGTEFVYGHLSSGYSVQELPLINIAPIFTFRILSIIFFFSFFIQLLYHYGIMQWIVEKLGWILQITVGTTAAESMNTAANIFVGLSEAPILIKPFLSKMTNSEIHAVMTGGFATIAGGAMAAYISMGIDPTYLLSASVMAAPAALGYSKLLYPETKKSQTTSKHIKSMVTIKHEGNALDAASQGAIQGVQLIWNIVANIVAFMAFVAFLDAVVAWFGIMIGVEGISFQWLLGKVFIPVAYLIGIDAEETEIVGKLLGIKTVVNEFVAYQQLKALKLSARSEAIVTYALCSFANASSIGVQLAGLSVMAPDRRSDLSNLVGRAFIAGSISSLLNACIAGTLLSAPGYHDMIINSTINAATMNLTT